MTGIPLEMPAQATAKKRARDGDDSEDVGAPRKRSREATPEQISQKSAQSDNPKKRSSGDELEEDKVSHKRRSNSGTPEKHAQSDTASINPVTGDGADDARPIATSGSVSHIEISPTVKLETNGDPKSPSVTTSASHENDKSPSVTTSASNPEKVSSSSTTPIVKVDIDEESKATPVSTSNPDNGFATSAFAKATSSFATIPNTSAFGTGFASASGGFNSAPGLSGGGLTSFASGDKHKLSSFASPNPSALGTFGTQSSSIGSGFKSTSTLGGGLSSFASSTKPALSSFASPKKSAFGTFGTFGTESTGGFKSVSTLGGGLTSFASSDKPASSSFTSSSKSAFGTLGTEPSTVGSALLPDPGPNGPESGEEGEKTIFTCKGKLFHFTNKEWKERGFGTFKVNSRDDDGKTVTRMIMRADGAGRVMLNSPVFKGMGFGNAKNEAPEGRRVFLTTTEDGNPVTLLLRAPNDATATELFEVLSDLQ